MRWPLLLVGSLFAASCGAAGGENSSETPTLPQAVGATDGELVLEVFSDSELGRMLDVSISPVEYPAVPGLVAPTSNAGLWRTPNAEIGEEDVVVLAEALGVQGDVVPGDPGFGGGWTVGIPGSGSDFLQVQNAFGAWWSMSRTEDFMIDSGALPCPTVAVADDSAGGCVGGAPPGDAVPPTDDEIDAAMSRMLDALDVAPDDVVVESRSYGSVAEINATFSPGGVSTDVRWSVAITTGGAIIDASGPWRAPEPVGDVDTAPLDEVILRLGRVSRAPVVDAPAAPPTTMLATTTMPSTSSVLVDVGASPVDTMPPPTIDPAQFVFPTITSVDDALARVWAIDNAEWFVPAYRLRGDNGFETVVPAIAAEHVSVVEPTPENSPQMTNPPVSVPTPSTGPPPTTVYGNPPATIAVPSPTPPLSTTSIPWVGSTLPRPTIPGPGVTLLSPEGTPITVPIPPDPNVEPISDTDLVSFLDSYDVILTEILAGRPLDEVVWVLEGSGWVVRTIDLDRQDPMNDDFRIDRANVAHRRGIVERVDVF